MLQTRSNKVAKIVKDLFPRRYPWQAHFFYETLGYSSIHCILAFLLNNNLQDGEYIQQYENQFKEIIDPKGFAYTFGTGRMALYTIMEVLNIGEGDEVILPAFTCEVVVHCLLYRGVKPVYADIEPYTYNIDVSKIEGRITKRTKAIIAQHTFGVPCELDEILALASRHGLSVIEDCAIALGSFYKGKSVGTFGDAAIFSTDRTKVTSTQWGGMAFTMDPDIAKKIERIYRQSPFLKKRQILNIGFQVLLSYLLLSPYSYFWGRYIFALGFKYRMLFDHIEDKNTFRLPKNYPYPCRLSNFQSFLGITQLDTLQENLRLRREMVRKYINILKENNIDLKCPDEKLNSFTLRFPLMLKDRESFIKKWKKYFEVGKWFDSPAIGWYTDLEKIRYEQGSCPVAEKVYRHIINFLTHQTSAIIRKFLYSLMDSIKSSDVLTPDSLLNSLPKD